MDEIEMAAIDSGEKKPPTWDGSLEWPTELGVGSWIGLLDNRYWQPA